MLTISRYKFQSTSEETCFEDLNEQVVSAQRLSQVSPGAKSERNTCRRRKYEYFFNRATQPLKNVNFQYLYLMKHQWYNTYDIEMRVL